METAFNKGLGGFEFIATNHSSGLYPLDLKWKRGWENLFTAEMVSVVKGRV